MNRINHDNYEAFLLDMVEGTISAADREELMLFLAEHPELDMDLDGLEFATLDDEGITFADKESLKKTEASRFDVLAVKQLEEGLTPAEQQELNGIVASNKKYNKELAAFAQTVLVADKSIVFKGKDALKREAVVRPLWYVTLSAAAAVALLVGGFWIYQQNNSVEQNGFATLVNNKGITIPTLKVKPTNTITIVQVDTNAQPKAVKRTVPVNQSNAVNTNIVEYAKIEPLFLNQSIAAVEFAPTDLDKTQPVALYMAVPYLAVPQEKPTLLDGLLAGLRKQINKGVKDEELALRLDTITKRGPVIEDLAFFGSKGFEKLTGYKPSFRKVQDNNNEVSSLSIGRYTFIRTRPKRED